MIEAEAVLRFVVFYFASECSALYTQALPLKESSTKLLRPPRAHNRAYPQHRRVKAVLCILKRV
jgi:hypothetical protein